MEEQTFVVQESKLPEFVKVITDNEIDNEIIGQSEDGEYYISVEVKEDDLELMGDLFELAEPLDDEDEDDSEEDDE